jgi:hypothetical protein
LLSRPISQCKSTKERKITNSTHLSQWYHHHLGTSTRFISNLGCLTTEKTFDILRNNGSMEAGFIRHFEIDGIGDITGGKDVGVCWIIELECTFDFDGVSFGIV